MSKLIQRTVYLSFALLGLFWTFKDVGTLSAGQVAVRFTLVPLALAFFNITFLSHKRQPKVTAIGFFLIGLAMSMAGFGFYAMYDDPSIVAGIVGVMLMAASLRMFYLTQRP